VAYTALQQACDFSKPCDPMTAFCGDQSTCQARIASGQGPCTGSFNCVANNYCLDGNDDGGIDDGGVRTCQPSVADGQPCQSYLECATGHCQDNSAFDAGSTCGYHMTGQPCVSAIDCVGQDYCVASVCVAPQMNLPVGSNCYYDTECQFDLWCGNNPDGGSGYNCAPRVDAGQPCSYDSNCIQGEECEFGGNNVVCETLGKMGDPCVDNAQMGTPTAYMCLETLYCDADGGTSCQPWLAPGSDCSGNVVCGNGNQGLGLCVGLVDGGYLCGLGAVGDACLDNYSCASGRCLQADGGSLISDPSGTCADFCP
jgi:hypothetical protein